MKTENKRRKKHSAGPNISLLFSILALVLILGIVVYILVCVFSNKPESIPEAESSVLSSSASSVTVSSEETVSQPQYVTYGNVTLDAEFSKLLLVNGEKPLPEDYNYVGNLITVEDKYINGSLKQIDKDVWPYMKAMIEAAWKDNVKLYIWSPYRSYNTQNMLFENQVKRCMNKGLDRAAAEKEAATVVARPGTSEHHTGLAADFNMASDSFENTPMYTWMKENAENYGFIMRYSAEKQPITGVIHESWHWRFVGINHAKKMNSLGLCLEEYLERINGSEGKSSDIKVN